MDRTSVGILGDHVTLEQGTGAVHTAPGHGQEDYVAGMQYGLEVYCPVDSAGRMFDPGTNAVVPAELLGKTVWEANPLVIEILREHGALMGQENISHSYPHCWRCHNATIFRATEQWFIGMDNNALRAKALDAIHSGEVDAGVGRKPHLEYGEQPARLVHLAAARVGRADRRLLLREVPASADGPQDSG